MSLSHIEHILAEELTGRILDCRSEESFARAHLPFSLHLPAPELPQRYGEIDRSGGELVIIPPRENERYAESFLCEHGFDHVETFEGGMGRWTGPVERGLEAHHRPMRPDPLEDAFGAGVMSGVVRDGLDLIRAWGRVLDVACGRGRNALPLAAEGLEVIAVDKDDMALTSGRQAADAARLKVQWRREDLERDEDPWWPEPESYDAVVVTNYLWRPLLPHLARAVRPGGLIAYETFLVGQEQWGHPTNPDYLLEPGELPKTFQGWEPLSYREGQLSPPIVEGPVMRVSLIAQRPMRPLS